MSCDRRNELQTARSPGYMLSKTFCISSKYKMAFLSGPRLLNSIVILFLFGCIQYCIVHSCFIMSLQNVVRIKAFNSVTLCSLLQSK
jgi:hypothetical protein